MLWAMFDDPQPLQQPTLCGEKPTHLSTQTIRTPSTFYLEQIRPLLPTNVPMLTAVLLLQGTIVNRTHGMQKNLYI